jgi:hypothetical protein
MTNIPKFPKELQPALDAALHGFREGKVNPDVLKPIYEWLEVDGWEALIDDLGEQMALNLGYLAQFQFIDSELRACMDIPDEQSLTDEDRIRWGRSHIDRVLNGDDEYLLPSIHTYEVQASDGFKAVIGCIVEIHGQAGPVCQWEGLWKSRDDFLAAVGDGEGFWVNPLMGEIPDAVILKLWQKPKATKGRSTKRAKNA